MRAPNILYFMLIPVLLFTLSCKKPFPVNPAGSASQKYNRDEIRMLRYELKHKSMDMQRAAVIKGLLWLLDFVQDDGNFKFIFTNYIPMLYEVSVINDDQVIRNNARRLIKNEGLRGEAYLESIFDENNIEDIILLIGILEQTGAPPHKYIEYYNKNLKGYDGEQCRADFYRAVKNLDYDKLTDGLCEYSHFRFAYKRGKNSDLRLPKDYMNEFFTACAALLFKYTISDESGYHDQNYYATHVVFVMTGYGEYRIADIDFTRKLKKYLFNNFQIVRTKVHDIDLLGEYVECMKIFGQSQRADVRESINFIISQQNPDGSWVKKRDKDYDPYDLFHPSWTSITALHYDYDCITK